jgi:hypothetical protein
LTETGEIWFVLFLLWRGVSMSSSGFPSHGAAEEPLPDQVPAPPPDPTEEAGLMERVLRETLAVTEADVPLDGAELTALEDVARRFMDTALSRHPVVVALVQAILSARFGSLACRPDVCQAVSLRIAETLWEDPTSHARLLRLWTRLTEAVR